MVVGQMIDVLASGPSIEPADLVVAHNARFDRPFCEAFSPMFAHKAWPARSPRSTGPNAVFEGSKLGYLIGQSGYFHDGHRAVDDCFALLEVLGQARAGVSAAPFAELHETSQRSRVRIHAENSPVRE